jgi:hypothetical protein
MIAGVIAGSVRSGDSSDACGALPALEPLALDGPTTRRRM